MMANPNPAVFRLIASLSDLAMVRRFVQDRLADHNVDPSTAYDVLLAVDEMVTNSLVHGYRRSPGLIEVEVQPANDSLLIYVRDQAPPFNPTLVPAPDLSVPLHKRAFGGMGIHLTRQVMDELRYRRTSDGGNEVTLIKKRMNETNP